MASIARSSATPEVEQAAAGRKGDWVSVDGAKVKPLMRPSTETCDARVVFWMFHTKLADTAYQGGTGARQRFRSVSLMAGFPIVGLH